LKVTGEKPRSVMTVLFWYSTWKYPVIVLPVVSWVVTVRGTLLTCPSIDVTLSAVFRT
jgi:hypothetical protein